MNEEPSFSVSEVSAMVGLSPHTIRIWERRYGLIAPRRSPAGHRRYDLDDIETLQRMKHLADTRGITLKMAAYELQGALPAPAWPSERVGIDQGGELPQDDSPWRAVSDLLPQPLLLLDPSGRIVDANVAFARAGGFIREQLRRTRFSELVDSHDRAKATAIWRPPIKTRRAWELNLRTPMGSGLYSFDCWPLLSKGHRVIALIGHDLSRAGLELWPRESDLGRLS